MRIRVFSDLHREFWAHPADHGSMVEPQVPTDADLIVLAGDTDIGIRGVRWAKSHFADTPVIYLAGNHEHYREEIGRLHEKLREEAQGSNIRILENEETEIDGYRFFGATLWTDFALYGEKHIAMIVAGDRERGMNDFKRIRRRDFRRFRPVDAAQIHAESRQAITRFLEASPREKSIVITHHAPSPRSLTTHGGHHDPFDPAYASNLEGLIHDRGPRLWIHGHIHRAVDYTIADTRILANPRGYPGTDSESSGFDTGGLVYL